MKEYHSLYHYGIHYFLCERFFPNRENDFFPARDEIVSFDCCLFPYQERVFMTLQQALEEKIAPNEQIIAVSEVIANNSLPPLEELGFEFCGFDLSEESTAISALTNCGNWDGIPLRNYQNKYGLLPTKILAKKFWRLLYETFPEEPHADCCIYAIWRKVGKSQPR